ncbi:MAG: hypothetical protein K1X94_12485 [Sandaracinaceae bacterium]|nr:hypothetical protein [Sandaracinaceae bacterium]
MKTSTNGLAWCLAACVIGASYLGAPAPAQAQEQPLQAANGAALYLGSLEGIVAVGAPIGIALALANGGSLAEGFLCLAVLPLCALFVPGLANDVGTFMLTLLVGAAIILAVPPSIAGVGGAAGWDADGSLVLTTGLHGLLEGSLIGGALDVAASGEGGLGAVLGGVVLAAGTSTYAALRHTELTHDPRVGVEANFLMWTPPIAMLLMGLVAAATEMPLELGLLLGGLVGLAAQAVCIGVAEAALAGPPPVMMAPMMLDAP